MRSRDIRRSFLEYFAERGHAVVPSSSLVPGDDPTLLFTNAGMNQFKDLFLGRETRAYTRAVTSQKCMRVSGKHNDLDNVGPSLRHHTFFEMLGNFSFGDYFKREAIPFAWELLTSVWSLPPDRLFPTIFGGEAGIPRDDEAYGIWTDLVPAPRITDLGLAENFWQMGETGPCGRCSEIHFYRGPHVPCEEELSGEVCRALDCSCDRYVEVWNNVFMEFDRQQDGTLRPLPAPSIDTGMGLERITAVIQGKLSNYDTDLFTPLLDAIGERAGQTYGATSSEPADVSMRVVADHLRAMTFLIGDGVIPSNEWRGYVLRKIMRRAMRHGKKLGLTEPFLHALVPVVVAEMGEAYPDLLDSQAQIVRMVCSEEERFDAVLTAGLPRLEDALDRAEAGGRPVPGDEAFRLYDSLGVPLDFMEDLAGQRRIAIDRAGFERAMEEQRGRGRAGSAFRSGESGVSFVLPADAESRFAAAGDEFTGYESTSLTGIAILGIFDEHGAWVSELGGGRSGYIALPRTPFYLEAGGQVSDQGRIAGADGSEASVRRVVRYASGRPRLHAVDVLRGSFRTGQIVSAEVHDELRDATRRNHTATHLLHAALRQALGTHVRQAGSLVAPERLRFDFVHVAALTPQELLDVERIVNEHVRRNIPVLTDVRSTDEAIASGAMALFGEKYGDRVRVVSVPGFSIELCGGTHVRATGDIGAFVITEEGGVAAGVRRIEAVTGAAAVERIQQQRAALQAVLSVLNTPADGAPGAVQRLQAEVRRLSREVEGLKVKAALAATGRRASPDQGADEMSDLAGATDVAGVHLIARRVEGLDKGALRGLSDSLRGRLGSGVIVLVSANDGKVALVASVTKDLTSRVQAGRLVKELAPLVGGGGGGRPEFAEAGGKDPSGIDRLLAQAPEVLKTQLQN